ncbi:excalibur calcium-binding domain-containing protein [Priestia megaterium]|uniref:excalibur calcium-binding domain-containing protein n=1 Tax=Priestia megaterium TaxID=1404 RepID=UPI002E1D940A|nr:excalibur calcium-binding domain-containing protein [Priestia megaterium]
MKKFLAMALILIFSLSFTSYSSTAAAAGEDKLKAEVTKVQKKIEDGKLIIKGDTNLPKKTKLLITLTNNKFDYSEQIKTTTKSFGKFKSKEFTDGKKALFSGTYTLTIQTLPAAKQSEKVQKKIGENGSLLTGDLIKKLDKGGKIVEYVESNIKIKSARKFTGKSSTLSSCKKKTAELELKIKKLEEEKAELKKQLTKFEQDDAAKKEQAKKAEDARKAELARQQAEAEEAKRKAEQEAQAAAEAKRQAEQQAAADKAAQEASQSTNTNTNVFYANCSEVRAAGAAPISQGQPGYSRKLDRDGDGIACDQ